MKKTLLTALASVAVLAAGVAGASPAQASHDGNGYAAVWNSAERSFLIRYTDRNHNEGVLRLYPGDDTYQWWDVKHIHVPDNCGARVTARIWENLGDREGPSYYETKGVVGPANIGLGWEMNANVTSFVCW